MNLSSHPVNRFGFGCMLPRVRAELALARSLSADEFAAVKGLRHPLNLGAYVHTLELMEAKLAHASLARNQKPNTKWKLRQAHE